MAQNTAKKYNTINNSQYATKLVLGNAQYWRTNAPGYVLPQKLDLNGPETLFSPGVCMTFDDGTTDFITNALPAMVAYGIKGTVYIVSDIVGQTGYMTVAQLTTAYNAGIDLGNHSKAHLDWPTPLTEAQYETSITTCTNALVAWGFSRAAYHLAFPFGFYNADVLTAMAATGILTGRTTNAYQLNPLYYGTLDTLNSLGIGTSTGTLSMIKYNIELSIRQGKFVILLGHIIGGSGQLTTVEFTELCQWINEKKFPTYTISQLYTALTGGANNAGFENSIGNWTAAGTHSVARSTVDKRTGLGAMRIIATGTGDTTSNYVKLDFPSLPSLTVGNTYTLQFEARTSTASRTVTARIGDVMVTSGTISTVVGTFTPVIKNFVATSSTQNKALYLLCSAATDTLYIDNISLTQAYDLLIYQKMRIDNTTWAGYMSEGTSTSEGECGWSILSRPDRPNKELYLLISDGWGEGTSAWSLNNPSDGNEHGIVWLIDKSDKAYCYMDGVTNSGTSIVAEGRQSSSLYPPYFDIGARSNLSSNIGLFGETQIVRFDSFPTDIASIATQISLLKKPLPSYNTGEIVGWWDWKQGGYDKSGNGNHLTNIGSAPIVRVK
jgi:peptidoglycan/xylan/chitin deacetylase (PgdA/CDA1 family)